MANKNLNQIQAAINRFMHKVARRNDPLEAYRRTDSFRNFQEATAGIIKDQAKYVADHLADIPIWDNSDLSQSAIEAHISRWLDANMPQYSEKMDVETVHTMMFDAWVWSIKAAYERMGFTVHKSAGFKKAKMGSVDFELTNQDYLDALNNDANYLLNTKSKSYDQTTKDRLITQVRDGRLNLDTIDEISSDIQANFDGISSVRAFMIANTETANAFGDANVAFYNENGVQQIEWVTAGPNPCEICQGNEDAGPINVGDVFPDGSDHEPAHPNCECYTQAVEINLDSVDLWDGS